jgi:hypothetical protein
MARLNFSQNHSAIAVLTVPLQRHWSGNQINIWLRTHTAHRDQLSGGFLSFSGRETGRLRLGSLADPIYRLMVLRSFGTYFSDEDRGTAGNRC